MEREKLHIIAIFLCVLGLLVAIIATLTGDTSSVFIEQKGYAGFQEFNSNSGIAGMGELLAIVAGIVAFSTRKKK